MGTSYSIHMELNVYVRGKAPLMVNPRSWVSLSTCRIAVSFLPSSGQELNLHVRLIGQSGLSERCFGNGDFSALLLLPEVKIQGFSDLKCNTFSFVISTSLSLPLFLLAVFCTCPPCWAIP